MIKKLLFFGLIPVTFWAQNIDNQLRLTAAVDYKFAKKWEVKGLYRYGLENDFVSFQSSIIQTEVSYKISKKWDVEVGYRYATSFENDNHRLFGSILFDQKINKQFALQSRTRYQWTTNSFDPDFMAEFRAPREYLRQRVMFQYNVPKSKWSFELGPEIFIRLDQEPVAYHRVRYYGGVSYDLKYGQSIGLTYFFEDRYKSTQDDRSVWNVKYGLSLDTFLKKIKKSSSKKNKEKKAEEKAAE